MAARVLKTVVDTHVRARQGSRDSTAQVSYLIKKKYSE